MTKIERLLLTVLAALACPLVLPALLDGEEAPHE